MPEVTEGSLQLTIPEDNTYVKFDDENHRLLHCMKAVDFIVETATHFLFIEFKDPEHPNARKKDRKEFIQKFLAGSKDDDFVYKYRDSFLYQWASGKTNKPIYYLVLVAVSGIGEAELLARTDDLKRKLPQNGIVPKIWQRRIVDDCVVFNIETWNRHLPQYHVSRMR